MREILFRGKRVDNGMWVEGSLIQTLAEESRENNVVNVRPACFIRFFDGSLCYEVEEDTVGQYTGLTDKNGKKIFEGDIVKHFDYSDLGYDIGIIKWDKSGCRYLRTTNTAKYTNYCGVLDACIYEVIGNIYDNPELIGGEKQ